MESLELAQSNRRLRAMRLAITVGLATLFLAALLCGLREVTPAHADPGVRYVDGKSGGDTTDCTNPDNPCATIAYALSQANNGDTIKVAAYTYTESLTLNKPVSLTGDGAEDTIIHAMSGQRVLTITGATITNSTVISGFTITGGDMSGQGGGIAIYSSSLMLSHNIVTNNHATGYGGGIYVIGSAAAPTLNSNRIISNSADDGGGIFNDGGTVTLTDSTLSGNTAYFSGGGIKNDNGGMMTLTNSTINDNSATTVDGGGIDNLGMAQLASSTVSGNSAGHDGGGIDNWTDSTVELTNSIISGNTAGNDGGGIFNNGGVVTLTDSTISSNTTYTSGGGIKNDIGGIVELTNSTVSGNTAITQDGGGIDNFRDGTVKLTNSTVSGNTADRDGGGIDNWGEGNGEWGHSTVELTNSTVSGNTANYGGGIANQGTVQLIHCTISRNTAYTDGGGIHNFFSRAVELTNTVVASQTVGADCGGSPVTSFGYNLDSDGTCNLTGPGDITNTNPLLGPLKDNGGDTQTHALLTDSLAIDHIPNGVNCCGVVPLDKDQRGETRPADGDNDGTAACDIGAFEVQLPKIYLPIIMKNH
jgi:parallel beta-helix repeat protein